MTILKAAKAQELLDRLRQIHVTDYRGESIMLPTVASWAVWDAPEKDIAPTDAMLAQRGINPGVVLFGSNWGGQADDENMLQALLSGGDWATFHTDPRTRPSRHHRRLALAFEPPDKLKNLQGAFLTDLIVAAPSTYATKLQPTETVLAQSKRVLRDELEVLKEFNGNVMPRLIALGGTTHAWAANPRGRSAQGRAVREALQEVNGGHLPPVAKAHHYSAFQKTIDELTESLQQAYDSAAPDMQG